MTDAVFEQLKHPNPHMRERAMVEIVDNRDETTIPRLMSILDDTDVTYRRAAVLVLGMVGADAVPAIVDGLLHSDNVTVRGSCAKALAQIAVNYPELPFPEAGLQGLKAAIRDDNPVVHIAAVMALGEMGTAAYDILLDGLQTDNVAVQVTIVNALASIGGADAEAVLTRLIDDESADIYVRESATSALSRVALVKKNTFRN
jgi:bilin biosynthesis protein